MSNILVASADPNLRTQIRRLMATGKPRLSGASLMEAGSRHEIAAAIAAGALDVAIIDEEITGEGPLQAGTRRTAVVMLSTTSPEAVRHEAGRTVVRIPLALNRLLDEVERLLPPEAPTTNMSSEIEDAFRALQRDYLASLPDRLVALRAATAQAQAGDKAGAEEARRIFHQVRGTGASFGLPDLTDAAARGETAYLALAANGGADVWTAIETATSEMAAVIARGLA